MTTSRQPSDEVQRQSHAEPLPHIAEAALVSVPLQAVLSTESLHRRNGRAPDHATENRALGALAQGLADTPRSVLQTLADTLLDVFKCGSAGVSLLSKDEKSFFWPAIAGLWQPHIGGGTPRNFGPCGDVLDHNAPLLFNHLERRYPYFLPVMPLAAEWLLVPFQIGAKTVGTVWVIAHDEHRTFDAENLRQLESLSRFAAAAYQTLASLDGVRKTEERYRTVFESIGDGFYIVEKVEVAAGQPLDFRYVEANPSFEMQTGISSVVGQTLRQVNPGESEDWFLRCNAVLETGQPITFERGLVAQGRLFEVHAFRIEYPTRHCVGVSFKDITDRKLAEDTLRERETFTRSIIESSPDCIKVLDLEGNLLSMQSGQELLGIEDIRPFLNTSWIEFWGPEHRQAAQAAVASAAAGKTARFVGFFRTFRGEPKWWDVAVSLIPGGQGKPATLLSVSRDVTQRKQAELNLEFLSSLSRDLVQWTNVDGMMQTIGAKVAAHLQLSICAFAEIDETAEQVAIHHDWHRQDVPSLVGVHRLADFVGAEFIKMARAGEVIVVRDAVTDLRTDAETFAALKIASFLCMPLIRDGLWRFLISNEAQPSTTWPARQGRPRP